MMLGAVSYDLNAMTGLLLIPALSALLLAALPGYRLTARLNVAATGLTLICALSLFVRRPAPGPYLLVDDLNGTFVVQSVPSPTTLTYQQLGAASNSGGSSGSATATLAPQLSSGEHQLCVFFQTRQGYITQPSPPVTWTAGSARLVSRPTSSAAPPPSSLMSRASRHMRSQTETSPGPVSPRRSC